MRVLVIGGTGFIGRHVVRHLVRMEHDLAVFHRGSTETALPAEVQHIHGGRELLAAHLPIFRQFRPDAVLQMVIPSGDDRTAKDLVETFKGVASRSVVTSSRDVYRAFGHLHRLETGPPDPAPLTEESPLRETMYPYRTLTDDPSWHDYDDILVERIVMGEPDLPGTVLRLPVIYGPEDDRFHRTFPYLKRMDDHRPAILIDARRAPWRDSRVYVEDAAWAIALAATDDRARGRVYNVAPLQTLTEAEWVEAVGREAGWGGSVVAIPPQRLPKNLVRDLDYRNDFALSSRRIREELGYREQVPFEEGLRRTIEWQRAHLPEVRPDLFDYRAEDEVLRALREGRAPVGVT